jgi:hypothetical protein
MDEQKTAHYLVNRYPERIVVLYACDHDGKKHKHHPDYHKPFEVEVLCCKCHGERRGVYKFHNISNISAYHGTDPYKLLKQDLNNGVHKKWLANKIDIPVNILRKIAKNYCGGKAIHWEKIYRYYGK